MKKCFFSVILSIALTGIASAAPTPIPFAPPGMPLSHDLVTAEPPRLEGSSSEIAVRLMAEYFAEVQDSLYQTSKRLSNHDLIEATNNWIQEHIRNQGALPGLTPEMNITSVKGLLDGIPRKKTAFKEKSDLQAIIGNLGTPLELIPSSIRNKLSRGDFTDLDDRIHHFRTRVVIPYFLLNELQRRYFKGNLAKRAKSKCVQATDLNQTTQ